MIFSCSVKKPYWYTNVGAIYSFPPQAHRIFVLNGERGRGLRESTHQQSVPTPRSKTLGELKKQVYDPNPTPKLLAKRVSLYYRDPNGANALESEEKEEDERRCTICLEEFEPKIEVMVTPCNHMFHEDCILPWLERQGQCPICRSEICKRRRENRSSSSFNINNNDDIANVATPSDLTALEFLSILRAMEEDVQLRSETRGFFFNWDLKGQALLNLSIAKSTHLMAKKKKHSFGLDLYQNCQFNP